MSAGDVAPPNLNYEPPDGLNYEVPSSVQQEVLFNVNYDLPPPIGSCENIDIPSPPPRPARYSGSMTSTSSTGAVGGSRIKVHRV